VLFYVKKNKSGEIVGETVNAQPIKPIMNGYFSLERRVPADQPLRWIKTMADEELKRISAGLNQMYSHTRRPSFPPNERWKPFF
jgi:hypothetical protein